MAMVYLPHKQKKLYGLVCSQHSDPAQEQVNHVSGSLLSSNNVLSPEPIYRLGDFPQ